MIALILSRGPSVHAVIDGIGIRKAMQSVVAVTEGHDRRRRDKAKRGVRRGRHRYPEPKPGAELLQHG